uniref:Uncharacterized protein n=1 Tax=viral metagenome TaxID=1070528 RepID=A0A6C0H4N5_9ZZZZ
MKIIIVLALIGVVYSFKRIKIIKNKVKTNLVEVDREMIERTVSYTFISQELGLLSIIMATDEKITPLMVTNLFICPIVGLLSYTLDDSQYLDIPSFIILISVFYLLILKTYDSLINFKRVGFILPFMMNENMMMFSLNTLYYMVPLLICFMIDNLELTVYFTVMTKGMLLMK